MNEQRNRLLLYAPNVHTGGGLVLLRALLLAWPGDEPLVAWLDERARDRIAIPDRSDIFWVRPSIWSRLSAEWSLASASRSNDRILCFHGLPPIFYNRAAVHVFQQNRLFVGELDFKAFKWRTRLRIKCERLISRHFRERVDIYWVQTPSMARELQNWYGSNPANVRVLPFTAAINQFVRGAVKKWDFLYVADGEAHKNHRNLIQAWILLSEQGLKPSLVLTLSERDKILKAWIAEQAELHSLAIVDLGQRSHNEVLALYGQVRALVFPSVTESFGLPLIEARHANLPILAGELDFVRDVCCPVQSFDPRSPVSIARAIGRFLGRSDPLLQPASAVDFIRVLLD